MKFWIITTIIIGTILFTVTHKVVKRGNEILTEYENKLSAEMK